MATQESSLLLNIQSVMGICMLQVSFSASNILFSVNNDYYYQFQINYNVLLALGACDQVDKTRVCTRGRSHELVLVSSGAAHKVGTLLQPDTGDTLIILTLPASRKCFSCYVRCVVSNIWGRGEVGVHHGTWPLWHIGADGHTWAAQVGAGGSWVGVIRTVLRSERWPGGYWTAVRLFIIESGQIAVSVTGWRTGNGLSPGLGHADSLCSLGVVEDIGENHEDNHDQWNTVSYKSVGEHVKRFWIVSWILYGHFNKNVIGNK